MINFRMLIIFNVNIFTNESDFRTELSQPLTQIYKETKIPCELVIAQAIVNWKENTTSSHVLHFESKYLICTSCDLFD